VVLGQMALSAFAAIGAAMSIGGLHLDPLRMGEVANRGVAFGRTMAGASLFGGNGVLMVGRAACRTGFLGVVLAIVELIETIAFPVLRGVFRIARLQSARVVCVIPFLGSSSTSGMRETPGLLYRGVFSAVRNRIFSPIPGAGFSLPSACSCRTVFIGIGDAHSRLSL